jgi:hypothetical protein
MEFKEFKTLLKKHIKDMLSNVDYLFTIDIDKDILWNIYLDSFPKESNKMYRKRREFDCSACRHFIKSFGNVVTINNNKITTIWDFKANSTIYDPVLEALSTYLKSYPVSDVFVTDIKDFGVDRNYEKGEIVTTWEHLHASIPEKFITKSDTLPTIRGRYRDERNVFKRSLDEITEDSILTILELISSNSLYKGEEWSNILKGFLKHKKAYSILNDKLKENYCWEQSLIAGSVISKIKNHSIGVLLIDISNGIDLDEAVRKYEAIVAPTNYKRPKAIFTQKMLEDAKNKITELGYLESLSRRFATVNDITVNNILFINREFATKTSNDVFENMSNELAINPKTFSKVEEVSIDTFIKDIAPIVSKIEVLFENKFAGNLVSLIAPKIKDSASMLKWDNGFSWAYSGNITDSMKERVKEAGGKIDGVLRFSIQWNDNADTNDDLDAHCIEPSKNHIYFRNKFNNRSGGQLDVDIIQPTNKIAVENITWSNLKNMENGTYEFYVRCYTNRGGNSGFSAEIEFNGEIHSFCYNKNVKENETIYVANVNYDKKNNSFTLIEKLPSSTSSRKVWNLDTNQFHPISMIMFSPNYWGITNGNGIGNRHYFFMLKDCINSEMPNGFFNEYLKEDLLKYKRVFEALGSKMSVESVEDQLSGIGFSSTKHNQLIVKVEGYTKRILKINI